MTKAKYVDGFVLTVPKKNVGKYKKMAADAARVWKRFGALDYKECIGTDMKPDSGGDMPVLSFLKMTKAKPNETVWFSFVTYKSKKHRDQVNKKVMDYFSKKYAGKTHEDMPFDTKRMAYGGFTVAVD